MGREGEKQSTWNRKQYIEFGWSSWEFLVVASSMNRPESPSGSSAVEQLLLCWKFVRECVTGGNWICDGISNNHMMIFYSEERLPKLSHEISEMLTHVNLLQDMLCISQVERRKKTNILEKVKKTCDNWWISKRDIQLRSCIEFVPLNSKLVNLIYICTAIILIFVPSGVDYQSVHGFKFCPMSPRSTSQQRTIRAEWYIRATLSHAIIHSWNYTRNHRTHNTTQRWRKSDSLAYKLSPIKALMTLHLSQNSDDIWLRLEPCVE